MYRLFFVGASLLVLERAEHRLLALDAHENAEDRRRDDDVAHGLVALVELADGLKRAKFVRADALCGRSREYDFCLIVCGECFEPYLVCCRPVCGSAERCS